ncbi:MAG: hypothetical protein HKM89_14440 [Gemmatimonadales bacterium]|nr:hypothetical protein [Gemmatimonadales bacterium]
MIGQRACRRGFVWVGLVGCAVVACDRPQGDAAPGSEGPALVASFPAAAQARIAADDRLSQMLHDFQSHLDQVRDDLAGSGVQLYEWYSPELRLQEGSTTIAFDTPAESIQVTYYFIEPGRIPCVLRGVRTDKELLSTAEECFGLDMNRQ